MPLVRTPRALFIQSSLALLAIPLFILNQWVVKKGAGGVFAFTGLFHGKPFWLILVASAWVLLALALLRRARKSGCFLFALLAATVIVADAILFLRARNYALAFYVLFLLILSVIYLLSTFRLLGEAYFNAGLRWFEGLPLFIPEIRAELETVSGRGEGRMSRFDETGCYVFSAKSMPDVFGIRLKLDEKELVSRVELISRTNDGLGQGLRFLAQSPDAEKDIREFVDRARSRGYVD